MELKNCFRDYEKVYEVFKDVYEPLTDANYYDENKEDEIVYFLTGSDTP